MKRNRSDRYWVGADHVTVYRCEGPHPAPSDPIVALAADPATAAAIVRGLNTVPLDVISARHPADMAIVFNDVPSGPPGALVAEAYAAGRLHERRGWPR